MKKYLLVILILFSIPQIAATKTPSNDYLKGYSEGSKDTACSILSAWADEWYNGYLHYKELIKQMKTNDGKMLCQKNMEIYLNRYLELKKEAEKYCDGK